MSDVARGAFRVSVLIPVLESRDQLEGVHREVVLELEKLAIDFEVLYLVGPESADALDVVRQRHREDPDRVRVVELGHSVGGAAMLTVGAAEANGEVLLTLPSCYEVEPSAIGALTEAIREGADLAFAARAPRDESARRVQSRIFNKLVAWAAGTSFTDITTDTRALRREVLEEIPLYGDFHRYLPVLAERVGFKVQEVAARQHPRSTSPGYHLLDYLWRVLDIVSIFFLSRFTRHPLRLFGSVGSAFAALGALVLAVVGFQRVFLAQGLADRPILVLGALFFCVGVQLLTIGLLGELILFFHARNIRDYRIADIFQDPRFSLAADSTPSEPPGGESRDG